MASTSSTTTATRATATATGRTSPAPWAARPTASRRASRSSRCACSIAGQRHDAKVIAGIDWVTGNHRRPAVANMSLGGGIISALDKAVKKRSPTVSRTRWPPATTANACNYSPARTPNAITSARRPNEDARSSFSNFGTCLDIFAPGIEHHVDCEHEQHGDERDRAAPRWPRRTSLARRRSYWPANPTWTPAQVRDALVGNATTGKVVGPGNRVTEPAAPHGTTSDTSATTAGPDRRAERRPA